MNDPEHVDKLQTGIKELAISLEKWRHTVEDIIKLMCELDEEKCKKNG